ncbi:hypothetical protein [Streptomyces bacillaris]|uniref:hypothetical protein n=1 Tax=Streptomyces bacillaris TaxID=68179 RepID=UPI000F76FFE1|nr:hypothetical protein [Streptomyces sp. WAC04770]RST24970.1 hypothetical protein EF908_02415 [Streptomyces sp. WAC04770]
MPTEYHLRLAGNGPTGRAILLCERAGTTYELDVLTLLYAIVLTEDPALVPDRTAVRAVLEPGTADALAAVDAMYRPLDQAALDLAAGGTFRARADRYEARVAADHLEADHMHGCALITLHQSRETVYHDDGPLQRGLAMGRARSVLARQLQPTTADRPAGP